MDKLTMAHDWYMKHAYQTTHEKALTKAWQYADAMQAEADKRNKKEAEQKRKEIREMLNAPNTFIEREGQHFDDLSPTWDQGPNVLTTEDAEKYKNMIKREFDLYTNTRPKIEKRKSIHAEESDWQPDWIQAPSDFNWFFKQQDGSCYFSTRKPEFWGDVWAIEAGSYSCESTISCPVDWKESLRERPDGK